MELSTGNCNAETASRGTVSGQAPPATGTFIVPLMTKSLRPARASLSAGLQATCCCSSDQLMCACKHASPAHYLAVAHP